MKALSYGSMHKSVVMGLKSSHRSRCMQMGLMARCLLALLTWAPVSWPAGVGGSGVLSPVFDLERFLIWRAEVSSSGTV